MSLLVSADEQAAIEAANGWKSENPASGRPFEAGGDTSMLVFLGGYWGSVIGTTESCIRCFLLVGIYLLVRALVRRLNRNDEARVY